MAAVMLILRCGMTHTSAACTKLATSARPTGGSNRTFETWRSGSTAVWSPTGPSSTTVPRGKRAATSLTAETSSRSSTTPAYSMRGDGSAANQAGGAGGDHHSSGATPLGTTALGPVGVMRSTIACETATT